MKPESFASPPAQNFFTAAPSENATSQTLPVVTPRPVITVRRSTLEHMPKWLICVPLVAQWLWLSLRYGSTTLPSTANPLITAGGLVGEAKLEYFSCMGSFALSATALHCAITPALRHSMAQVRRLMARAGVVFPLIAKPDLGMCGFGVRLITDEPTLATYFAAFPSDQVIVLQEYLAQDNEAGIFYARQPGARQGQIIGLALRYFPQVFGDGHSTLAQLIAANPRTQRVQGRTDHEFTLDPKLVPAAGQCVRLSTIGSTRIGGLYRDGASHISPALLKAVDAIAGDIREFYFGRLDVRFSSLEALRRGMEFKIMEVNGAGSEAIQAWDPDTNVFNAFRIIFSKQRLLFAIGHANRSQGHQPISLRRLAQLHFMQQRLLEMYPPSN